MHTIMQERLEALEKNRDDRDRLSNIKIISFEIALSEDIRDGGTSQTCQLLRLGVEIPTKEPEVNIFHMAISAERVDLLKLLLEGLVVEAAVYHQANDDIRSASNEIDIISGVVKTNLTLPQGEVTDDQNPDGLPSIVAYEITSFFLSRKEDQIIELLREWLIPLGIQVYQKEKQPNGRSAICFFYAPVKDAILWFYQTSSDYYELSTKEIARQMELWDRRYGVTIAGAGKDWVDLWFHNLYIDKTEFRWEATEFCPQLVLENDWNSAGNISEDGSGLIRFRWR